MQAGFGPAARTPRHLRPADQLPDGAARSCSPRFHRWLFHHPRFGHAVRAWRETRAIPPRAKLLAVSMMAASLFFVILFVARGWVLPEILAAILTAISAYIVSRPNARPSPAPATR